MASPSNGLAPMDTDERHYFRNGAPVSATALSKVSPAMAKVSAAVRAAVDLAGDGHCIRLFVAGAVSHVGKTTVCLSILAALRQAGLSASELAYVKPATQCEAPDLLKEWCDDEGIEYVSGEGAPLVFYSGFTRSFLSGEQGTSTQWLERIAAKIDDMSRGRRVLVVDGVGFPAVGSIVGVDNADVAKAARSPVLLVCKSGVGAAVDSFSLNCSYFLARGVPVLGVLFNMGDLEGFNSWDKCAENIQLWFSQSGGRRERYYGVVPVAHELQGLREKVSQTAPSQLRRLALLNAVHFASHVDLPSILEDAALDTWCRRGAPPAKKPRLGDSFSTPVAAVPAASSAFQSKSRASVAAAASKLGAKGGG
mmetsp:Transcript_21728/g.55120  ORF Transcript_21728/g.55120 Transcript_21728/m.55120 type:complete len:366 (+) Transcript_21728:67-1164(+)